MTNNTSKQYYLYTPRGIVGPCTRREAYYVRAMLAFSVMYPPIVCSAGSMTEEERAAARRDLVQELGYM